MPFPSPGDLPDQGVVPGSPTLQADSLPSEPPGKPNSFFTSQERSQAPNNECRSCGSLLVDCVECGITRKELVTVPKPTLPVILVSTVGGKDVLYGWVQVCRVLVVTKGNSLVLLLSVSRLVSTVLGVAAEEVIQ